MKDTPELRQAVRDLERAVKRLDGEAVSQLTISQAAGSLGRAGAGKRIAVTARFRDSSVFCCFE